MENHVSTYLAIDMGAESARAIVGHLENDTIVTEEIHRWPSRNTSVQGVQYWDVLFMFTEIKTAIQKYVQCYGDTLSGIGVDSWGVDFGLLGKSGQLLQNPVQYRDHRTDGLLEQCKEIMPHKDIYRKTGIAFLPFNTLLQLWSLKHSAPELLREGHTFLMMSDLLHYFLSGVKACEYTNASTTQLLDATTRTWSEELFTAFDLPIQMMPNIIEPGTILGPLDQNICKETGLKSCDVITPCTHDTASAILAIPAEGDDWAYISCGTWSLLGAELDAPITTEVAREANFTNEGGQGNTIRFLKNIVGLWILQQVRVSWRNEGQEFTYPELTSLAEQEEEFQCPLDVSDPRFYNPQNMLEEIRNYYKEHGQKVPASVGATVRAILEGIAVSYALNLSELESITGKHFKRIHIVGGGIQNKLLCQMASNAMGRTVLAGPVEGTALGNITTQALAKGDIADRKKLRKVVRSSVSLTTYEPQNHHVWTDFMTRKFKRTTTEKPI